MSDAHDFTVLPHACIVTSTPDRNLPIMTALISTGPPWKSRKGPDVGKVLAGKV